MGTSEGTKEELIAQLQGLPDQRDPQFGFETRRNFEHSNPRLLSEILEDQTLDTVLRFKAFYILQFLLRRANRYSEHREATGHYRSLFHDQPLFLSMLAEHYGDLASDDGAKEMAITYARKAVQELPQTAGVHHVLAEFLLESIELSAEHRFSPDEVSNRLSEAESHAGLAISLSEGKYAKFYSTLGRVQAQLGMYSTAITNLNQAIDKEDTSRESGRARVLTYQAFRREIVLQQSIRNFREENLKAIEEFRSMRSELLSLLGLLAAVVAFISTSTSIAGSFDFPQSMSLLLGAGAVILAMFFGFSLLFTRKIDKRRGAGILVVTGILTLLAVSFPLLFG